MDIVDILYSDNEIAVAVKPCGVLSTDSPGGMPERVRSALGGEARTVHRLDQVVGGLMLLARSAESASALGKQVMDGGFEKEYLAVVRGAPPARGTLRDLLARDKAERKTYVANAPGPGVQEAVLDYTVLGRTAGLSLLRIRLHTGRTHQIRAQFSARGWPLVGDRKYGGSDEQGDIALWSARLGFTHPATGRRMEFTLPPPDKSPWTEFDLGRLFMETEKTYVMDHTPCPLAKKCGGCQMQNLPYARQLEIKQGKVNALMGKFCHVDKILGCDKPYHYRNKVQAAFGLDAKGRIISGVYQSSSHRIVPVDDCMLEDETADKIIVDIRKMLPQFKIPVYDERRGGGWLRHVLVKRSFHTGEVMVVLVAVSPIFKLQKPFLAELLRRHPEITTVLLNVNPGRTSLVLGKQEKVLFGKGYIEDELCSLRFRISAKSFYQINPAQTERLYRTALDFAALTGRERVLDAYCGTGTIGLAASGSAGEVAGVELNADAVRDAIANAKRNGVKNCWFTCADAGEFMEETAAQGESCDVVFMDPPRAGSDARFLTSLIHLAPRRVVYVSCNPETLARDCAVLTSAGYRVRRVQPVDMFPHTEHVECVCLLEK